MKKIALLLAAAIMALGLAACSESGGGVSENALGSSEAAVSSKEEASKALDSKGEVDGFFVSIDGARFVTENGSKCIVVKYTFTNNSLEKADFDYHFFRYVEQYNEKAEEIRDCQPQSIEGIVAAEAWRQIEAGETNTFELGYYIGENTNDISVRIVDHKGLTPLKNLEIEKIFSVE